MVGYYTISNKVINIEHDAVSKTMGKRLFRYGIYNQDKRIHSIPAILIGQLSKNFDKGSEYLISGSDLLQMAFDRIHRVQTEIGGHLIFLECEDKPKLLEFYLKNGFVKCGKRKRDRDEVGVNGDYLIQMIMYLR